MRKISIDTVKPGMKLGRTIYNSDGNVLLGSGVELKDRYIKKLKDMCVYQIYVDDDISKGINVKDVISEDTRNEAKIIVRDVMKKAITKNTLNASADINHVVNKMIDELLDNRNVIINLNDIRVIDDYTFGHCVNVCVLSLVTGIALNYDQIRLRDLGVGALLHDVGKIRIPIEILSKPGPLNDSEYEEIKKHTLLGFDILRNCDTISRNSAATALGHHERYNGTGYPIGLSNDRIHEYAKIASIADVYDAMTSDRIYRKGIEPFQAVEYLVGMGNSYFDYEIVKIFIQNISIYPIGSGVVLNTREKGLVVGVNKNFPTRPKIRIIYDKNGNVYHEFKEVDLAEHPTLFISETCSQLM